MIALQLDTSQLEKELGEIISNQPKATKIALGRTASLGINVLLERNQDGKGLNGSFKPYSDSYAMFRNLKGRQSQRVDLNFTGKMSGDLAVIGLSAKRAVISATSTLSKKKVAHTHQQRPWFGFTSGEENRLMKMFVKQFRKML